MSSHPLVMEGSAGQKVRYCKLTVGLLKEQRALLAKDPPITKSSGPSPFKSPAAKPGPYSDNLCGNKFLNIEIYEVTFFLNSLMWSVSDTSVKSVFFANTGSSN
jgi:hypothetical protein